MLGGAAGSLARFVIGSAIMSRIGGRFPWGTIVINVTGSFLIGFLMTWLTERFSPHPNWRLLLVGNRDEFHARPSLPLMRWEQPSMIAGKPCLMISMSVAHTAMASMRTKTPVNR